MGVLGWRGGLGGGGRGLGCLHLADGLGEPVGREDNGEPSVDGGQDIRFAEVDVARVAYVAGEGVFLRVAAPVVGITMVVLALHPALAEPAVQPAAQGVGVADPLAGLVAGLPGAPGADHDGLGSLKVFRGDQRLLGDGVGPDPLPGVVPAQPGFVAAGDVVDVEENLVLALLVPDLPAGVAGIAHDGANSALGRSLSGAVRVADRVMLGWGRDGVAGEPFGDGEQAAPGEVFGEDAPDHPCGLRVRFQLVQPSGGPGGGGVRPSVGDAVAVGGTASEEPSLDRGLGGHGGADPYSDPGPLALRHAAEHRHDQVVSLGVRVDGAADFGDPQPDPVVGEDGHGQAVLVAIKRPLRLADHHGVEAPIRVGEVG